MYKIAISTMQLPGKIPQEDKATWAKLTKSFANREVDLVELIDAIYTGCPFAPWVNGTRSKENFICGQHIGVDLDTTDERSTIDTVKKNYFFRMYGSIIYTTPSHTPQAPKCRAIFLLDEPIANAEGYRTAMRVVYNFFDGSDVSCIDPSRFFYSNANLQKNPDDLHLADGVLPLGELRRYLRQLQILERKAELQVARSIQQNSGLRSAPAYAQAAVQNEAAALAGTSQGGRNHQLNRAAFNLGTLIGAGALQESDVEPVLAQAARQAGLTESEVKKTLASGLRAGIQNPRAIQ